MNNWSEIITNKFNQLSNLRTWRPKSQANPRTLRTTTHDYLNFTSNDYLGLNGNPALLNALIAAASKYGTSSTGAPSLGGISEEHIELANNLALWLRFEEVLLCNSGYQLNVSLFAALADRNTQIWLARNSHASHIDGVLLSRAKFSRFTTDDISTKIAKACTTSEMRQLIISEGSFSMDGTSTNLAQLIELKSKYPDQVLLIIDDAHGIGALGKNGRGTLEELALDFNCVDLLVGTLGKAFASHGGFIAGKSYLINYLKQTMRSQIYSTMLPPHQATVSQQSLKIIQSEQGQELRSRLKQNINYFKQNIITQLDPFGIKHLVLHAPDSNNSPIQLLMVNDMPTLEKLHDQLLSAGILVGKISYPTVPKSLPRLRISLNSAHTNDDFDYLINQFVKYTNRL